MRRDKCVISFVAEDLEHALEKEAITIESLTDYEWAKFYNSFLEATNWSEAVEMAAEIVASYREDDAA